MTNVLAGSRAPHHPALPTSSPHAGEAGCYPGPLSRRTDGIRMTDITRIEGWERLPASVREQVDAYVLRVALFQAVPVTPCTTGS
ncbi:hypothetical protein Sros01_81830 [Streptomyces roseochromogenus]|nr:hypothetical protein Sros01_81830 [Streptomyces roseochromogenus]